jgi:DNA polymerase-1
MKKILIIDSSNLMHRAFHGYSKATRRVLDNGGNDVTALAGFLRMTTKMIKENNIGALVFVMDPTGDDRCQWRNQVVPTYKEGRSATDPALKSQISRLPGMLAHLGLPVLTISGAEADDAIVDVTTQLKAHPNLGAIVVSADKDLFQALNPTNQVTILRGAPEPTTYQSVTAKHGVTPDRWSEYSALIGEGADNLPGICGIGPKKAVALIEAYSNIQDCFSDPNLDSVVGKAAAIKVRDGELDYHNCKTLNELGTGTAIDLARFKLANINLDNLVYSAPRWLVADVKALAAAIYQ